jgi:hypothetical protein
MATPGTNGLLFEGKLKLVVIESGTPDPLFVRRGSRDWVWFGWHDIGPSRPLNFEEWRSLDSKVSLPSCCIPVQEKLGCERR